MKRFLQRDDVAGRKIDSLWQTKGNQHDKTYYQIDFFVKLDNGFLFQMGNSVHDAPLELSTIDQGMLIPLSIADAERTRPCLGCTIVDICCAYWSPYFSILLDNQQFLWIEIETSAFSNELTFSYFFKVSPAAELDLEEALTLWDRKSVKSLLSLTP